MFATRDALMACLILMLGAAFAGFVPPQPNTRLAGALRGFQAVITNARGSAPAINEGVTIEVTPSGSGTLIVERQGRPLTGTTAGALMQRVQLDIPISVNGATTFALFIDSQGRMTFDDGWTEWTTLATEPAFVDELPVVATLGTFSKTETLDCTSGALS